MKKEIPIALKTLLDKRLKESNGLFNKSFSSDYVVRLNDSDPDSDYYFEIRQTNKKERGKEDTYSVVYEPYQRSKVGEITVEVDLKGLENHFDAWLKLLEEANTKGPLFDDTITQAYYDELEPNFKIIDEDADYKPFSINQQKLIVSYLDKVKEIIENGVKNDPDKNNTIELIEKTKLSITKSTKKKVIENVRKIGAKAYKIGLQIGEKVTVLWISQFLKKIFIGE